MEPMHSLLKRQIKKYFGSKSEFSPELNNFFRAVNQAYSQFDLDRKMIERSMDLSSRELSEANSGMQAMLQAWPDIIFRLTNDGTIIDYKTHSVSDLYTPQKSLPGKRIQDIPDREISRKFDQAIIEVSQTNSMVTIEYTLQISENEKTFEARLLPIVKSQLMVIIRNITDRKKLEKIVFQNEKLSAVGQLAAGIAHEINNPLGIILGFAQSLKSELSPKDSANSGIDFIEREALRCKALIQNLLVFSRSSRTDQHEAIDISSTVEDSLSLILAQSRVKDIELTKNFGNDLPKIMANRNQIQQIVVNLCNNAMDAMPKGGTLTVAINRATKNRTEWVELKVTDTGIGIPKDMQVKIFEPFFTTKEVGKGTGLGLSLVHEIVQKHRGSIEIESVVGKGTSVSVYLPVQSDDQQIAA